MAGFKASEAVPGLDFDLSPYGPTGCHPGTVDRAGRDAAKRARGLAGTGTEIADRRC
jgi:hypothetical protein